MSNSVQPHRQQPTRPCRPWDSPDKNSGVGCHFLLQCMKVKSESEITQSCLTLSDPMDCSLPGSSIHGIFQARVLEWVAIAFYPLPDAQVNKTPSRSLGIWFRVPYSHRGTFVHAWMPNSLLKGETKKRKSYTTMMLTLLPGFSVAHLNAPIQDNVPHTPCSPLRNTLKCGIFFIFHITWVSLMSTTKWKTRACL